VTFYKVTGFVVCGFPMLEITNTMLSLAGIPLMSLKVSSAKTSPLGTEIISVLDAKGMFMHI
jgi:hypothetical protein